MRELVFFLVLLFSFAELKKQSTVSVPTSRPTSVVSTAPIAATPVSTTLSPGTSSPSATLPTTVPTTARPTQAPSTFPPDPLIEVGGDDDDFAITIPPPSEKNIDHRGEIYDYENPEYRREYVYYVVLDHYPDSEEDVVARNVSDFVRQRAEKTGAIVDLVMKLNDDQEVWPNELLVVFNSESWHPDVRRVLEKVVLHPNVDFIERSLHFRSPRPKINASEIVLSEWGYFSVVSANLKNKVKGSSVADSFPGWNLDRIDQIQGLDSKFDSSGFSGKGVTVYVMDSGVNCNHPDFESRCTTGFVAKSTGKEIGDHGTHVAGIIAGKTVGVAKQAKIISVKILDGDGAGDTDDVIEGLNWVSQNLQLPAIINLSLEGEGKSPHLASALGELIQKGAVIIGAAGNGVAQSDGNPIGQDACLTIPASTTKTITVASTNREDTRSSFSNFGSCINIFAPGEDIVSASATSTGYKSMSGTSQASPLIAGIAALYLEKFPKANHDQFLQALRVAATQGIVRNAGQLSPNLFPYTRRLLEEAPAPSGVRQPCDGDKPCVIAKSKLAGGQQYTLANPINVTDNVVLKGFVFGSGLKLMLMLYNRGSWVEINRAEGASKGDSENSVAQLVSKGRYSWVVENVRDVSVDFELQYTSPNSPSIQAKATVSSSSSLQLSYLVSLFSFVFLLFRNN